MIFLARTGAGHAQGLAQEKVGLLTAFLSEFPPLSQSFR